MAAPSALRRHHAQTEDTCALSWTCSTWASATGTCRACGSILSILTSGSMATALAIALLTLGRMEAFPVFLDVSLKHLFCVCCVVCILCVHCVCCCNDVCVALLCSLCVCCCNVVCVACCCALCCGVCVCVVCIFLYVLLQFLVCLFIFSHPMQPLPCTAARWARKLDAHNAELSAATASPTLMHKPPAAWTRSSISPTHIPQRRPSMQLSLQAYSSTPTR